MAEIVERRGLSVEVPIKAPVDAVWKALSEADELTRWFPTGARIEPGVGGKIVYMWREYGDMEFESPIAAWEPNRHLRLEDQFGVAGGEAVATDYYLEPGPGGEGTVLRLVQSGFTSDEDWDEMYDGIRRGWAFELRALKHYLENHRGRTRRVICLQRGIGDRAPTDVWSDMVESERRIVRSWPNDPKVGDTVTIALSDSEVVDGAIRLINGRRQVGLHVPALNDALVRLTIEPNCSQGFEGLAAGVFAGTYDVDADRLDPIRSYWTSELEGML